MMEKTIPQQIRELMSRAGLVQGSLAHRMGFKGASSIQRYLSDEHFKDPVLPNKIAVKLETALVGLGTPPITKEEIWALTGVPISGTGTIGMGGSLTLDTVERPRPKPNASFPPRYQEFPQDHTIPLLGQTAGGPNGRFILNGTEIGRVFCPPMLEGVEGAYAVMVYGTSMEPRYFAGETVWVNPHLPVRAGDDVIAQIVEEGEDQPVDSYIKRFESRSSRVLRLYQYNPDEGEDKELEFDADKVFSVHKIVFQAHV